MGEQAIQTPSVGTGIVLIGYRATGKTTIGRLIAELVDRPFLDCDAEIEARSGRTINDWFANSGEEAFRDREEMTICELCDESPGAVLATGGGSILRLTNQRRLAGYGTVFCLHAPTEILVERLRNDPKGRPALTSAGLFDEVEQILSDRKLFYAAIADFHVDVSDPDPQSIAEVVVELWRQRHPEVIR